MTTLTENQQPLSVIRGTANIHNSVERIKRNEVQWGWREIGRRGYRTPLETVIYLTPAVLDENDLRLIEKTPCRMIAFTRGLSRKRISFSHDTPLRARHVIATFDLIDNEAVSLLIEILWRRHRSAAWRLTGGKLLGVVEASDILR
ncbi:MAG: hypothetical protein IH991_02175 [Planctomycetes bacterium]|nr:hypothetical protein [Planctomycetota bacterium]